MSPTLALFIGLFSILSTRPEPDRCPDRAVIDRVEGDRVVLVHGAAGVRSISVSAIDTSRGARLREGARIRREGDGRCVLIEPERGTDRRVRARLRALVQAH